MRRFTYRRSPAAAHRDLDRLVATGFLRAAIEDDPQGSRLSAWVRSAVEERVVRRILGAPDATGAERLDREALNDWRVRLAPGCWLLGPGVAAPRGARTTVTMPVGSGFGLGDHPTTVLAAALVCRLGAKQRRMLDLGCGSGVLAALAGKLGASTIDAVDLDADSVSHTRRTLKANQIAGRVWTSNLLKRVRGTYDLVAANLVGDLLVEFFATGELHRVLTSDGRAVLSGISDAKQPAVVAALRADGWRVCGRIHRDGWWGLVIRRVARRADRLPRARTRATTTAPGGRERPPSRRRGPG